MNFKNDVAVVGGCGRVGLPLGLAFASRGLQVTLYDINEQAVRMVAAGQMPFSEPGADQVLERSLASGNLKATADPALLTESENVITVIGTPIDEHLNPDPYSVLAAVEELQSFLVDGQLLVLRSTIYPGVTRLVENLVSNAGKKIDVAFCPERIAEGKALTELFELPQIVAGRSPEALDRSEKLFRNLTDQVVRVTPEEAELAKLFTNTWRYIKFATANQLYMIANDFGLDFERVREAITFEYPRAADMPSAGFAAGPCLFKDTMQLAAFNNNNFILGHAAMMINEGLPLYLVARLELKYQLAEMRVGILGMAFKAESDDNRSSLSYKLKRILRVKAKSVLCTDPFVTTDPDLLSLEEVVDQSDLLVIGAPHAEYKAIKTDKPIVDLWNLLEEGVRI